MLNRSQRGNELPIIITILRSNLLASPACGGAQFAGKEFKMGVSKANDGEATNGDWRELAHRLEQETDPRKMTELAEQLIAKLDEERARRKSVADRRPNSPAT
ncbi:MAG: hypothetical protein DMG73_09375 [Acidobacteria bacterium]|nr:MAG: hypothetical protein DMG73_09375 [Acidobacteriota bacterium]PYX62579.1 MAG: hypothetical protein DMG74_20330 [Acidobacteriota bacterium]